MEHFEAMRRDSAPLKHDSGGPVSAGRHVAAACCQHAATQLQAVGQARSHQHERLSHASLEVQMLVLGGMLLLPAANMKLPSCWQKGMPAAASTSASHLRV